MKILITAGIAVVLVLLAALLWHWFNAPLYRPGDVRAEKSLREPLDPPAQTGVRPEYWRVAKDIELFHFEQGAGEDILVVHGGPGFSTAAPWRALTNHRLVYYHQRGCGQSTRPLRSVKGQSFYQAMQALNGVLGLPAQVSDIERVRRILGHDKLVLAGHSFGAFLAALYAAEFPEHVRALIAIAPANLAVLPNREGDAFELIRSKLPAAEQAGYRAFLAEWFDFRGNIQKNDEELAALYRRFGFYYAAAVPAMKLPAGGEGVEKNGGLMSLAVYLSMGRKHDYRAAFRAVRAPVLVVHGRDDLQPVASSRAFADQFPNHRLVEISGAGHFVFDDRPAEFAAAVEGFLAGL